MPDGATIDEGLIPAHAGKTTPEGSSTCGWGAHPRSRGENLRPSCGAVSARRLIPAHAGKTPTPGPRRARQRAHPRSRGENHQARGVGHFCAGSSPLTRGKLPCLPGFIHPGGLIPAHAGKTCGLGARQRHPRAHPRSRGENRARTPRCRRGWGSSPLTRGKPKKSANRCNHARLIPAHAGKTLSSSIVRTPCTAHPRSRGENGIMEQIAATFVGSSPLTRGKPTRRALPIVRPRLIPAHAGKTRPRRAPGPSARAHPRSRGENTS